jgi:hypothetical protein
MIEDALEKITHTDRQIKYDTHHSEQKRWALLCIASQGKIAGTVEWLYNRLKENIYAENNNA